MPEVIINGAAGRLEGMQDFAQVFRIELVRERARTDDIAKQHRQISALSF